MSIKKISSIREGETARQINLRATSSKARLRGLRLGGWYGDYFVNVHYRALVGKETDMARILHQGVINLAPTPYV